MVLASLFEEDLAEEAREVDALLGNGPDHLSQVEARVAGWLDRQGYESPDQVRGKLSQHSVRDPAAFERANYLKVLAGHRARG